MGFNLQSLHYVILIVGLSAVSIFTVAGFLNNVFADNMTMGSNMTIASDVNASSTMNQNMNMTNQTTPVTPPVTPPITPPKILSPLQQFKSGVEAKSVQCKTGFTLIIKAEDSSPACVSSPTAQTLTARGWGTMP